MVSRVNFHYGSSNDRGNDCQNALQEPETSLRRVDGSVTNAGSLGERGRTGGRRLQEGLSHVDLAQTTFLVLRVKIEVEEEFAHVKVFQ